MARLLRPVMKIISVMPAATASSTAYWIRGLSTIGSISFGCALVAGRKRLPRPATGKTALRILFISYSLRLCILSCGVRPGEQGQQARFVEHGHAERLGFGQLAAGLRARDDI